MSEWFVPDDDFDLPFEEEAPKPKKDYTDRNMPVETFLEHKGVKHLRELLEVVNS